MFDQDKIKATLTAIWKGYETEDIWHQRLGHPSSKSLKLLSSNKYFDVNQWNKQTSIYASCQMGKSCKLPFNLDEKNCR